ncbi:hypothetical protein DC366_07125 [Pelagivirga sediminicola]|uniref:Uncharacterized protein n=2 Tax=Pelagivirga sediminicola TaxID=2170575 RepID=A0A2T7G896_9RHOB|nr:hypothetical protein DC366_07125 [Pelagivirga sediminicola]
MPQDLHCGKRPGASGSFRPENAVQAKLAAGVVSSAWRCKNYDIVWERAFCQDRILICCKMLRSIRKDILTIGQ